MPRSPFHQLDDDWRRYCNSPDVTRAFDALRTCTPTLSAVESPAALVRLAHRGDRRRWVDDILAQLTANAVEGDQHSARIVLQALVPGLQLVAVRLNWTADASTVAATVITTAWDRICTYPIDRRPRRIAANIIRDTQHRVRRELHHPRETAAGDIAPLAGTYEVDLTAVAAADHIRRHVRRGTISRRAATIIVATRLHHEALGDVALATGRTEGAVRRQRERAEARLRRAAA